MPVALVQYLMLCCLPWCGTLNFSFLYSPLGFIIVIMGGCWWSLSSGEEVNVPNQACAYWASNWRTRSEEVCWDEEDDKCFVIGPTPTFHPHPSPISIEVGWLPVGPAVILTIFRYKTALLWLFQEYIQLF